MQEMLNAEYILEIWPSVALVLLSGVLCVVTRRLAVETKRLGQIQVEPRVSIRADLNRRTAIYELVVSNEGLGVAKNIQCEFEGDKSKFRSTRSGGGFPMVDELHFIRHGIEQLESRQVYRYFIGGAISEEIKSALESPWVFRLKYENLYGETRQDTQVVEFSLYTGSYTTQDDTEVRLREISTHLRDISSNVSQIHKTLNKPRLSV